MGLTFNHITSLSKGCMAAVYQVCNSCAFAFYSNLMYVGQQASLSIVVLSMKSIDSLSYQHW